MFEILPKDWNLKPIFTLKWAFVDMNWGRGFNPQPPDNSNPAVGYPSDSLASCFLSCCTLVGPYALNHILRYCIRFLDLENVMLRHQSHVSMMQSEVEILPDFRKKQSPFWKSKMAAIRCLEKCKHCFSDSVDPMTFCIVLVYQISKYFERKYILVHSEQD